MREKLFLFMLATTLSVFAAPQMGSMTDSRDGKTYKTVKIGNQVWMAENLDYATKRSYCYDVNEEVHKNSAKCNGSEFISGRLYTYAAAINACPNGWHLPTSGEFETLVNAVGGKDVAGKKLKATNSWNSYDYWDNDEEENKTRDGNGSDDYGFSARAVGYVATYYGHLGEETYFWCDSKTENEYAQNECFNLGGEDEALLLTRCQGYRNSVRCIKD